MLKILKRDIELPAQETFGALMLHTIHLLPSPYHIHDQQPVPFHAPGIQAHLVLGDEFNYINFNARCFIDEKKGESTALIECKFGGIHIVVSGAVIGDNVVIIGVDNFYVFDDPVFIAGFVTWLYELEELDWD